MDPIKVELYKESRKKGKSKKDALIDAGYAVSTASDQSGRTLSSIVGDAEILAERVKAITPDFVLERLLQEATKPENKASDKIRAVELLGNYLKLFKDENKQTVAIYNQYKDLDKDLPTPRKQTTEAIQQVEDKK